MGNIELPIIASYGMKSGKSWTSLAGLSLRVTSSDALRRKDRVLAIQVPQWDAHL